MLNSEMNAPRKELNVCMIGYGLHEPWNEGCAVVFRNLASAVRKYIRIHTISIIDQVRSLGSLIQNDVANSYLDHGYISKTLISRGNYSIVQQLYDVGKVCSLIKSIDTHRKIDIIHIFNLSHFFVSAFAKILCHKNVVAHTFGPSSAGDFLARDLVDIYVCTSHWNSLYLTRNGIPPVKVRIVPPLIDCNVYRPLPRNSAKVELGISENSCLITYIGNIYPERLSVDVIGQLERLGTIRHKVDFLVCCPDTNFNRQNAETLRKSLSKSEIRCRVLVSNLSDVDKNIIYNTSDILIFPYLAKVDSYNRSPLRNLQRNVVIIDPPLAVLEAMACGRVVVASKTLSIPEIIKDGKNGFLFEPGDFEKLGEILKDVARMRGTHEFDYLKNNARKTILKRFSADAVVHKILDVYDSLNRRLS